MKYLPNAIKGYILQFADLYHQYKIESENLRKTKYSICSSLDYYKKTKLIQLSYNDKPGDFLPPMSIKEIKNMPDVISGMHPIDVNSINDLYYLSKDKISKLVLNEDNIQVLTENGDYFEYDINTNYDHENVMSKRISFLLGYMQAEKIVKNFYENGNKYKILRDNITSLSIVDLETKEESIKNAFDILFSEEYKSFSKEDIAKIGYICGQMTTI